MRPWIGGEWLRRGSSQAEHGRGGRSGGGRGWPPHAAAAPPRRRRGQRRAARSVGEVGRPKASGGVRQDGRRAVSGDAARPEDVDIKDDKIEGYFCKYSCHVAPCQVVWT